MLLYYWFGKLKTVKTKKISAIAFDLDGTLYPNYRFYIRLLPFLLREQRYLRAFGKARDWLRSIGSEEANGTPGPEASGNPAPFYKRQALFMEKILKKNWEMLENRTEKIIYRGWEPLFKKVKLFPHVIEMLKTLRGNGLKLGMLSDFPLEKKIEYLGLGGFWDVVLCSEEIGRLKPDPLPFYELAKALVLPPEEILYVGNSFSYDVLGAAGAGMKTAWIRSKRKCRRFNAKNRGKADFVFYDYRQLCDFVLM
jgi:putative hydrolase of the HAD superfamily